MREAARLLQQAIDPFKPPTLHPERRARHIAGEEVEQSADADAETTTGRGEMLVEEQLLLWIAHGDKQHIRLGATNEIGDLGRLAVIEMAATTANHFVPRAQFGQPMRRALGDAWLGSEQKDAIAMLRPPQVIGDEIRSIQILRKWRPVEDATRDVDAKAVVEDDRVLQRQAECRVLGRDVQRVSVREGDSCAFT